MRLLDGLDRSRPTISDWSLASDLAYARALLNPDELARFQTLYDEAILARSQPNLWIVLNVPPPILAVRKATRLLTESRADDQPVPLGWLIATQAAHLRLCTEMANGILVDVGTHESPADIAQRVVRICRNAALDPAA
jgi:hypothetical protein